MKVLHILPSFGFGGMEKVFCAIVNGLPSRIHQEILSINGECSAKSWIRGGNFSIVNYSRPSGNYNYFRSIYQVIKQSAPDLLMTYNWGATDAIWLGRLCGVPYIVHSEHGFNVDEATSTHWKRDAIRYFVYRCATKLIVVSRDLEHMMETSFKIPSNRVAFIPNGIDTDFYGPNVYEREKVRDALGLQPRDLVIGYVGRLDPVKNLHFLVRVVAHCVRMNQNFKLVLIGDGPEKQDLVNWCLDQGIREHVLFVGRQENVLSFLQSLDVFVLTSFREQMPISMLEAMSVGVPVVASAVGEIPAILKEQDAGFVQDIREGDEAYASAVCALQDPHVRHRMGQNARNLVVKQFQERLMIQRYIELFETITHRDWCQND